MLACELFYALKENFTHLASSLKRLISWKSELLTIFNNSQRLNRMDSGTLRILAEIAEFFKESAKYMQDI